jgi:hypothetical protein
MNVREELIMADAQECRRQAAECTRLSETDVTPQSEVIMSGDHTADLDVFAYEYTTASWFFIDAADVMAPADTIVVCAFGDSITDGTHTTFNINDRWSNVLSRRLHNAYGNKVSVVNEAIGASPMWSGSKASTIWAAATPWSPSRRATRVSSPRSMRTALRSWAPP